MYLITFTLENSGQRAYELAEDQMQMVAFMTLLRDNPNVSDTKIFFVPTQEIDYLDISVKEHYLPNNAPGAQP